MSIHKTIVAGLYDSSLLLDPALTSAEYKSKYKYKSAEYKSK
jgi:hypothetical protein